MFGKKQPVFTGRYCDRMEKLRLAIEVLNGHRAIFIHVDFNTEKARLSVGGVEINVVFIFRPDGITFLVETDAGLLKDDWYLARFDFEPGEVRVISQRSSVKRGDHTMWWAGCSATERRLEPLHKDQVEYCAKVRGLTVEEYLKEKF